MKPHPSSAAAGSRRRPGAAGGRAGYTLLEVIVASSIGAMVAAAVLTALVWSGRQANLCSKIAWSQTEAVRTNWKVESFLRGASSIVAIDAERGTWVEVELPTGERCRLVYTNGLDELRDGRLYLRGTNRTETIVARGLTGVMSPGGYTTPVFTSPRANTVRVAYRVSEPVPSGERAADDEAYAATVRFAVCLRNASP